jgi:hypothetical protein
MSDLPIRAGDSEGQRWTGVDRDGHEDCPACLGGEDADCVTAPPNERLEAVATV